MPSGSEKPRPADLLQTLAGDVGADDSSHFSGVEAPGALKPVPSSGLPVTDKVDSNLGANVTIVAPRTPTPPDIPPPPFLPFSERAIPIENVASFAEELRDRKSADTPYVYDELTFAFRLDGFSPDESFLASIAPYVQNFRNIHGDDPPVWAFTISGERQTWRFMQVRRFLDARARLLGQSQPGFMAWGARVALQDARQNDDSIDEEIRRYLPVFRNCTFGQSIIMDLDAERISFGDRNRTYVTPRVSQSYDKDHNLVLLQESVQLQPGGSKHQYMRDSEMEAVLSRLRAWHESGDFTALTVEGPLRIGKSRLVLEVIKTFGSEFPDVIVGFVPAMDAEKNMPRSYFLRYVKKILEATRHLSFLQTTDEFRTLARYVLGQSPSLPMEEIASALARYISFFMDQPDLRVIIFQDDAHWVDVESQDLLARVFREKRLLGSLANVIPAREGDEPLPLAFQQIFNLHEKQRIRLGHLKFLDDNGEPVAEYKKFVCELLGYNVTDPTFRVQIGDTALIILAEKSDGNPGVLEGLVKEAVRTRIIIPTPDRVEVDIDQLRSLASAGEADSALINEVERFIADPDECAVLSYILVLSEIGNCTSSLLETLFDRVFQQPRLLAAYNNICDHKNILSQDLYTDEVTISRTRRFIMFFRKRVGDKYFQHIYSQIGDVFHRLREVSSGKQIVGQCSAYNIYRCAHEGRRNDLKNHYCFDAFHEAYAMKDYQLMLEIYEYVKSEPLLSSRMLADKEFVFRVLEAMYNILGKYIGKKGERGEYLDLGESLHNILAAHVNTTHDPADFARLCDIMIGLSYWRTFTDPIRGMEEIYRWMYRYRNVVLPILQSQNPKNNMEIIFAESYHLYPLALLDYLAHQFISQPSEQKEFFSKYHHNAEDGIEGFLNAHNFDLGKNLSEDPRYIRMRAEVLRLHANMAMVRDAFLVEVDDGIVSARDDVIHAHMLYKPIIRQEPEGAAYYAMHLAYQRFKEYLEIVTQHPERMEHRNARYMALQAAGRTSAIIGSYSDSLAHLTGARNLAQNSGDYGRLGEFTVDLGTVIQYLIENLLADPQGKDEALWDEARKVYRALSLDYPRVASPTADLVQNLLIFGNFFLRKGIDTSRENQKLLSAALGRFSRLENASSALQYSLSHNLPLPDISEAAEDVHLLYLDFCALLAFETTDKSLQEYWLLYGMPVIARFLGNLRRSAQQGHESSGVHLATIVDALKWKYDEVVYRLLDPVLDATGKPVPDPAFDVPVMRGGQPWIDPRNQNTILKSYQIHRRSGLPYLNEDGTYRRHEGAYLFKPEPRILREKKCIGINPTFYDYVLRSLQACFHQSFLATRPSIKTLETRLQQSREDLVLLMRSMSPFEEETRL